MKCILVGNYGVGNVGDEALKEYFLSAFPEFEWSVLQERSVSGALPRLPAGLRSFCTTPWWKTISAIKRSDAVIFGGGSLFTDTESPFACLLWFLHAWVATICRTPYFLAFQGIGPFRTKWGRGLAMWSVKHSAYVSLRDEESVVRLTDFTMNTKCIRTFDPVILSIRKSFSVRSQNVITIIPRSNSKSKFIQAVQNVLAKQKSAHISILLMQPDDSREKAVADTLLRLCKGRGSVTALSSFEELCENVAQSSSVLTERYHGALAALALRVPVKIITMAEGDKLSSLRMYAEGVSPIEEMFTLARHGEDTLRAALQTLSQ